MKKILFLFILASTFSFKPITTHAQTNPSSPALDSLVNTDTAALYFTAPGRYLTYTLQADMTKANGTVAGKVYLQALLNLTGNWKNLDSLSLQDISTVQTLASPQGPSVYYYYRFYVTSSGTQKYYIRGTLLKE